MKSALDLILERLEGMSNDEIVNATSYTSEAGSCEGLLEGYEFFYTTSSSQTKALEYNEIELNESFEYELKTKVTYNEKAVEGYKQLIPLAA